MHQEVEYLGYLLPSDGIKQQQKKCYEILNKLDEFEKWSPATPSPTIAEIKKLEFNSNCRS